MRHVVVGGGIVGVAAARLLATTRPGDEVVLLEREASVALHQSGRNSGVVHAGVYYAPGSLKAQLCRRGADLMAAYCEERGLPYARLGKVVVATGEEELPRLDALERRAQAAGVPGLARLDAAGLRAIEPAATGIAALHSPTTAVTDFAAVARRMADELRAAGGELRTGEDVERITPGRRPAVVATRGGHPSIWEADRVLVCAGLQADRLARASGAASSPRIVPFRGEYRELRPERAHLVRGLIYPVPDPALPFLGVHLTRHHDGRVLVGPNAVPALALDGYSWRRASPSDLASLACWRGARRLARSHWRTGAAEMRRSLSRRAYAVEARRYVPAIAPHDLRPGPAGVRAQAVDDDGTLVDDFRLEVRGSVVWVRNAPSPAATSSLALAELLVERLGVAG